MAMVVLGCRAVCNVDYSSADRAVPTRGPLVAQMTPAMRLRLEWRREHVVVGSKKIVCLTYDRLFAEFNDRLDLFASAAKVVGS